MTLTHACTAESRKACRSFTATPASDSDAPITSSSAAHPSGTAGSSGPAAITLSERENRFTSCPCGGKRRAKRNEQYPQPDNRERRIDAPHRRNHHPVARANDEAAKHHIVRIPRVLYTESDPSVASARPSAMMSASAPSILFSSPLSAGRCCPWCPDGTPRSRSSSREPDRRHGAASRRAPAPPALSSGATSSAPIAEPRQTWMIDPTLAALG